MSAHTHDSEHDHAHEHVHGYDSFLDRHWMFLVITFGVIVVSIFAKYNPTAN